MVQMHVHVNLAFVVLMLDYQYLLCLQLHSIGLDNLIENPKFLIDVLTVLFSEQ